MAEYDSMTVVEITITVGMTMTTWRDALYGRVIRQRGRRRGAPYSRSARQQVTQYTCGRNTVEFTLVLKNNTYGIK